MNVGDAARDAGVLHLAGGFRLGTAVLLLVPALLLVGIGWRWWSQRPRG